MDRAWLRAAQKLHYNDPRKVLIALRQLEAGGRLAELPAKVRSLRTNRMKKHRERRHAALFAVGMSARIGQPIFIADEESQDYDFVASWVVGNEQHFAPVQLKEVVPPALNPSASLGKVITELRKYTSSAEDLTVAIHLNRTVHFEPQVLQAPQLPLAALWVFGSISVDQSKWALWGNFLEPAPYGTTFEYPAEA